VSIDTGIVLTLVGTELKLLLRDRRTVLVSIVLPLLVMPLLLFAGQVMEERRHRRLEATRFTYLVTGSQVAEARRLLEAAQRLKPPAPSLLLEEVTTADPIAALADASLDLWVQALAADESPSVPAAGAAAGHSPEDEATPPGAPVLLLVYRADRDRSGEAMQRVHDALRRVRQAERSQLLADAGLPLPADQVLALEERDVASAEQVTGLRVGRLLTVFFLLFIFSGGAVVATDTLAGEKERGTLETLLTTAAGRREIIAAKLLSIFAVALAVTLIQALNFLAYLIFRLVPRPAAFTLDLSPATALAVLVMLLPVAALVSAVLLLTSGIATTYKEAQLYFFPTFLLTLAPALASFLPGLTLRSVIALVPIAGVAVGVKEILTGAADLPMLLLTWLVSAGAAAAVALAAERTLSSERLIAATAEPAAAEPSPQLFQRHVLRAFAVLWATLLLVSINVEGKLDLRLQTIINLVGVLLVGTLVLVRRYRLNPRHALALRPVRWPVWLAVAIGAPAGLLTGIGVFRLANLVVPVPPEMIEAFSEVLAPEAVPLWQGILFLAVLPGICEELAFRGLLTYGLHRRLHPLALVLVVALVFGVFHVALFRIAPIAYLGMLLTTVTLLTGSVFPAMVWHALHNALALGAAYLHAPLEEASATLYGLSTAALAVAAAILWRARTPYPHLRWKG
jgi:sodium transport system permease protein